MNIKANVSTQSNFDLKRIVVARATTARTKVVSLADLEAARVGRQSVPASKFGLEVICGASCETGAQ
ncbi:hypothetical protein [Salinarimonas sp.]|uniref:hypothetical protein n=1 Tax=Salinarimonas sp. TaxID=2766526 RepID=UPI0032D91654